LTGAEYLSDSIDENCCLEVSVASHDAKAGSFLKSRQKSSASGYRYQDIVNACREKTHLL
jgi:hypothetical protein